MKFRIRHTTTYSYRRPVTLPLHRLLLTPRGDHDLRVLARKLDCQPEADLEWTQDVFGNIVATVRFAEPASELVIAADLLIEQSAPQWPVFRISPGAHSFPFSYSDDEAADLGALLRPSTTTRTVSLHAGPKGLSLGRPPTRCRC